MKNMIKRIIIGVSIGLIIGFINSCEVNAATVNVTLPTPTTFGQYEDCGTQTCTTVTQWPPQTSALYNGYYTSQWISVGMVSSGYVRYEFGSPGYCDGQNISISGSVILRNGSQGSINKVQAFLNSSSNVVTCSLNGSYFTCTGKGGGYLSLYFEFSTGLPTDVLVNRTASVVCDATLNDLLQQQQNNTNSIINNQNQNTTIIKNSIDETNDFLKDDSLPDNTSSDITDMNNEINSNGTITNLITLPITFLQKIINTMEDSCSPIVIGELYDYNFTLPCINPSNYIGMIWNIIDVICCGFLVYKFSMLLVRIFHRVTSLKDGGLEEAYD